MNNYKYYDLINKLETFGNSREGHEKIDWKSKKVKLSKKFYPSIMENEDVFLKSSLKIQAICLTSFRPRNVCR